MWANSKLKQPLAHRGIWGENVMLNSNDLILLGSGTQKLVYQHPEDATKVIKVMSPSRAGEDGGIVNQGALRRHYAHGIYRQFRRELLQYLQLCKNSYAEKRFVFPIETPHGFVATDQGLGLITEKIIGPSGEAEVLFDLCESGRFGAKHAQALAQFFDACCDLHIVFGEVNKAGILYTESRTGHPEFVLVDGIGEKLLIPLRRLSKTISSRYVRKVEQKILQQLNIDYSAYSE